MAGNWSQPTSWAKVCCRAGGRKRYNAERKRRKQDRRMEIICRTAGTDRSTRGLQAVLAQVLGVSKATICRDLAAIRDAYNGALFR